ncbi:MAG: ferrochelatase [Rhodospirillales bacterium]|nr:ferrochelatase [Rhodospirillales bacterium]
MTRLAVVLFNLGGPDSLAAVEPFLFNLFDDPAIIDLPTLLRRPLAKLISKRRAPTARAIYAELGGGSPLLAETEAQAVALQREVAKESGGAEVRVFIAMRYWHPMSDEAAAAIKAFAPDEIVLLPLYPQYSTTTTGSSLDDWQRAAAKAGLTQPTRAVCCYPTEEGFVRAQAVQIAPALAEAASQGRPRLLFSAHGLPKKVVAGGDPYQWQVERTCVAVVAALADMHGRANLDWVVCYQSRVGPLQWIGPSIEDELARAGGVGVPVVVVPIAFVSEHSETLVELDIEYRKRAREFGVPDYVRVRTPGVHKDFIAGLSRVVGVARQGAGLCAAAGARVCPAKYRRCPLDGGTPTA